MYSSFSRTASIKRSRKESYLKRIISELLFRASLENKLLSSLSLLRVQLSQGKTVCYVYMYTVEGEAYFFDVLLEQLKLYKPSMRKAIAEILQSRYTVDIMFKFDATFEKVQRIERLIDSLAEKEE